MALRCLVPWAPVLPSASVRPPAPQRGARSLRTTTIWSALILCQIGNYWVVLEIFKSEKVQKKGEDTWMLWCFDGRKGKTEHRLDGGGGWVVGLGGRMREIGRGNGSREAKWVEAWVQG